MAQMLPLLAEADLKRIPWGEAKVYRWLAKLPNTYHVFYSVKWAEKILRGLLHDREADFVVSDPARGLLVVEVKGGGISIEDGRWYTSNRFGDHIRIKDPFEQAKKNMYSLVDLLHSLPGAKGTPRVVRSVIFPDIAHLAGSLGAGYPRQIVGTEVDLQGEPASWIARVFEYQAEGAPLFPITGTLLQRLTEAVLPSIEIERSIRDELGELGAARIRLTSQQAAIVRSYRAERRLTVRGAAGTGKTLVALETAKKRGLEGKRTAYVCYNRQLANVADLELKSVPNAGAFTFHAFCKLVADRAKIEAGIDLIGIIEKRQPGADMYDVILPEVVVEAVDFVKERFDAIIVDEAQDFKASYWIALEAMLASSDSIFWAFGDENQTIYDQGFVSQLGGRVCELDINCRNGSAIHDLAYEYYSGDPVESFDLPGAVTWLQAESISAGSELIAIEVRRLLERGVKPGEITVLIAGEPKIDYLDELRKRKIVGGVKWLSAEEQPPDDRGNEIAIDTVRRFKGLENCVIFVWGADDAAARGQTELLYVGFSRAMSRLFVVGDRACVTAIGTSSSQYDSKLKGV